MPKTLIINRHAKSSWENLALSDFERPLNHRGKADAPMMGDRLKALGLKIDAVVSSPAQRAIDTARMISKRMNIEPSSIIEDRRIYMAGTSQLLKVVNQFNDAWHSAMLFGHNPGLTEFIYYLSGTDVVNLPTCGIAVIEFPAESWAEVSGSTGHLAHYDYPKNI